MSLEYLQEPFFGVSLESQCLKITQLRLICVLCTTSTAKTYTTESHIEGTGRL